MTIQNHDEVVQEIKANILEEKKHEIGKLVRDKARFLLLGHLGQSSNPLADDIHYEVTEDGVRVYTNNIINKYIEEGTDPHTIEPDDADALSFMSKEASSYDNGEGISPGDTVTVQKVEHPGTEPRPFFGQALALAKNENRDIIENE